MAMHYEDESAYYSELYEADELAACELFGDGNGSAACDAVPLLELSAAAVQVGQPAWQPQAVASGSGGQEGVRRARHPGRGARRGA